jgi:adhesin HecA-like repeat protein
MPTAIHAGGALQLHATNNTNTFGYWQSSAADVSVEAERLYRGTFEVRTDVTDQSLVPQMRLRFNTANLQASRTLGIESIGDGANSPATSNTTYDSLYFLPPANCIGEGLIVSFDLLNFNPNDAVNGALILDSAKIETLAPPALP